MVELRIRGVCPHDCPDTCAVVTTVRDGKAVAFEAEADHPVTKGWLCAKVRPYLSHVHHPDRLLYPLRRVGPKGSGQWERIGWDEAIATIADRWRGIIAQHGPEAILPYSYSGTLGLVQMGVASARFWNRLGASQLERSICGSAAEYAVENTLGARWSPPYSDVVHSKLVILWGSNPATSGPHFMPFLKQAQRQGSKVVVIDPRRTITTRGADWHLRIQPGTDGYLALAIAAILVEEQLHDEEWLARHTIGWPLLKARLAEFTPAIAAQKTGIAEPDIRKLASLYAHTRPGLIKINDGINRNLNGGQNVRAILTLPALTGQYGKLGGGLAYSTSGYFKWSAQAIHHWADCPRPGRKVNMCRLGEALMGEAANPPIQSLFVFGANPATSSPNAGRIVEGLKREDLFTVVHELFLTDTADFADIVLPATSQLEQADLHKAYGHTFLTYNHQALAPLGECKSNWDLMRLLAKEMGFDEPWLRQGVDDVIEEVLNATAALNPSFRGITLARLKSEGSIPLDIPTGAPFADGNYPTPSGKVELYCQALADAGHDPVPGRFAEDIDPIGGPFRLVTGAAHHFVSSSFANQPAMLAGEGNPFVEIHPEDAGRLGVKTGENVWLTNGRGSCRLRAVVTENVMPGLLVSPKGYWSKLDGGRNVNWLTSDLLADFAGQSTYHSTRVDLIKE